jgi:predicted HAD superfamily Cof-like phosphohydrolase
MSELQKQVIAFHLKFGHPIASAPVIPDDALVRFRVKLIVEECLEVIEALFDANSRFGVNLWGDTDAREALAEARQLLYALISQARVDVHLPGLADGLGDLDYVSEGTRLAFGLDGDPIAAEIQRSNMLKEPNGQGKPTKPEGWTPPDIAGEIRKQRDAPLEHGLAGLLSGERT